MKKWYAVQNSEEDTDWGYGSADYNIAVQMANKVKRIYGYARIVEIENEEAVGEEEI